MLTIVLSRRRCWEGDTASSQLPLHASLAEVSYTDSLAVLAPPLENKVRGQAHILRSVAGFDDSRPPAMVRMADQRIRSSSLPAS